MKINLLHKIFLSHSKICIDTRNIVQNSIFFCLKGKNFNGNKFAQEALDKGCSYVVIDDPIYYRKNKSYILVDNALKTLQNLAKYHRKEFKIPVIGITGSNGKTTSKELLNETLKKKFNVVSTIGNLNNHIGVPLTILRINEFTEFAIIEMGANKIGEIDFLCKIASPNIGIITNIGKAHIEGFKSIDGILKTKTELYRYLEKNKNSIIFINAEEKKLLENKGKLKHITYGETGKYSGKITNNDFFISVKFKNHIIKTNLIGDYQLYNIMLALSVGLYFQINIIEIIKSIKDYTPSNNRSEIIETKKKNKLILDAYNSNPSSMMAMLSSFKNIKYKNKICIIGDMMELGRDTYKEHKEIYDYIKKLEIISLFVGKNFKKVDINNFKEKIDLIKYLKNISIKKHLVLIKGSRSMKLEEIIKYL